ncbi:GNAT family N-acetyltransferase [Terrimonas rubra]|uniref:GNAT family N-acetyltransferase n=1 Tax=Terrimonas rubra TaxID=1035890 RepID=A0ABW6A3T7_9BACT
MTLIFETPRFIARQLELSDRHDMFRLDSDPEVHQYLGNNPIQSIEEVDAIIRSIQDQYARLGVGRLAIIDKVTDEFMGWAGLKKLETPYNNQVNVYDLGYRLLQQHWGKGVATETARGSLAYGFDQLQLDKITAMADCANKGSNQVLIKVGMQLTETFMLDGVLHNWYELDKDTYRQQTAGV